jgi:hypothetical protein
VVRRLIAFTRDGSPLSEAGSSLPFPLRPAEFHLCRMPRGRRASARPHLCGREGSVESSIEKVL